MLGFADHATQRRIDRTRQPHPHLLTFRRRHQPDSATLLHEAIELVEHRHRIAELRALEIAADTLDQLAEGVGVGHEVAQPNRLLAAECRAQLVALDRKIGM